MSTVNQTLTLKPLTHYRPTAIMGTQGQKHQHSPEGNQMKNEPKPQPKSLEEKLLEQILGMYK